MVIRTEHVYDFQVSPQIKNFREERGKQLISLRPTDLFIRQYAVETCARNREARKNVVLRATSGVLSRNSKLQVPCLVATFTGLGEGFLHCIQTISGVFNYNPWYFGSNQCQLRGSARFRAESCRVSLAAQSTRAFREREYVQSYCTDGNEIDISMHNMI